MDTFERHVLTVMLAAIVTGISAAFVVIMLKDGNTQLVSNVSQDMLWLVISIVAGIASVILGINLVSIFGKPSSTTTTITSNQSPIINTPATTIVQQKAEESSG